MKVLVFCALMTVVSAASIRDSEGFNDKTATSLRRTETSEKTENVDPSEESLQVIKDLAAEVVEKAVEAVFLSDLPVKQRIHALVKNNQELPKMSAKIELLFLLTNAVEIAAKITTDAATYLMKTLELIEILSDDDYIKELLENFFGAEGEGLRENLNLIRENLNLIERASETLTGF